MVEKLCSIELTRARFWCALAAAATLALGAGCGSSNGESSRTRSGLGGAGSGVDPSSPAVSPSTSPSGGTIVQPSRDPKYASYRSSRGDQLFFYQGDLRNLGSTVDEIALTMKPYDVVVLTNMFRVAYAGSDPTTVEGEVRTANGTCTAGGFSIGADGPSELMRAIRNHNPNVRIYGYVPAIADLHVGANSGCTSDLKQHQNFVCPGGTCADFVKWIGAWENIEQKYGAASALDGFFIDLANEFYVSDVTWANETGFIKSRSNARGETFKILANITAYNKQGEGYFYVNGGDQVATHSVSSVRFAANRMQAGDAILFEGFLFAAGAAQSNQFFDMTNDLVQTYKDTGVRWAVISSEQGNTYVTPGHVNRDFWQSASYMQGDCYVGPTGESLQGGGPALSRCDISLVAPAICNSPNHRNAYETYRKWADAFTDTVGAGGGMGFLYSEARLGVFTGVAPFCANDEAF